MIDLSPSASDKNLLASRKEQIIRNQIAKGKCSRKQERKKAKKKCKRKFEIRLSL
jgi:hypothetical protein